MLLLDVKKRGNGTEAIHNMKVGDYIGIKGPLGNGFTLPDVMETAILVGGGIGISPLKFLMKVLQRNSIRCIIINAAKTKSQLIINHPISGEFYCTDDGSYGAQGIATDLLEDIIIDHFDHGVMDIIVYTCGPEKMMYKVFQLCEMNGVVLQACIERMMHCGCGLCGSCTVETGDLTCMQGPVFTSKKLREIESFGECHD